MTKTKNRLLPSSRNRWSQGESGKRFEREETDTSKKKSNNIHSEGDDEKSSNIHSEGDDEVEIHKKVKPKPE